MNTLLLSLVLVVAFVGSASGIACYFCSTCPTPFYPDPSRVTRQVSSTAYCAKKSYYSAPGAVASRGPAEYGLCTSSGCSWRYNLGLQRVYVCCCRGSNDCNTGSSTSKSTFTMLLGATTLLIINRYI